MSAFAAAGWLGKQRSTWATRTVFRELGAFLLVKNYPRGPISTQILDGRPQDIKLQKGLDTLARRDHMRIWSDSENWAGQQVWIAASIREDISATFSPRTRRFVHHVDSSA